MDNQKKLQVQVIGMVWYAQENYQHARSLFEDGDNLPATYEEWLKKAETIVRDLENKGARVIRANIVPNEFVLWCKDNNMKLNAAARTRFGNEAAYKVASQE